MDSVLYAIITYLSLAIIVPKVIKEPTGIKIVDDVVLLLISQKGSLMSGAILIGLIVYLSNMLQNYFASSSPVEA